MLRKGTITGMFDKLEVLAEEVKVLTKEIFDLVDRIKTLEEKIPRR